MGADECNVNQQTSISKTGNNLDHQQEDEACNPFCGCSCCGHNVAIAKFLFVKTSISISIEKKQPSIHFFALQNVLHNIWQPPQLG